MSEKEKQNFLRDVQDFWEKDVEIKKILMDLLKAESSMNGVYQMQRYVNLLRRTTNSLEGIFKKMIPLLKGIPSNLMLDFVTKFFAQIQIEIESCDCTAPGIHKLVTTRFSDMKESFLNVVNQNCVACYLWFDLKSIVEECTSINELLHFYHAYIINNLDYTQVGGLSIEIRTRLEKARPETIGAATRLPGMTPAAITALSAPPTGTGAATT